MSAVHLALGLLAIVGILGGGWWWRRRSAASPITGMFEQARLALLDVDSEGTIRRANARARRLLSCAHGDPLEEVLRTPDGDPLSLYGAPTRGSCTRSGGALVQLTVIPSSASFLVQLRSEEGRPADSKPSSLEERFRVLIEYSSDSILILAPDGSIHYHSPSLRRMVGQQTRYGPGISFQDFVHPEDRESVAETLKQVLQAQSRSLPIEFRLQRRREEWSYMQGRATNLLHHPDVAGIVLNLKDISDSKRLEVQLMQAQKMEAIGRLAGGVAHDFNNLLTAIQGYTDIVLRSMDAASEEYDHMCQIQQASERAAALTQQLLAFSRQKTMQQQEMMLNEVLEGTQDMLKRIIGEDVQLSVTLSPATGTIMADPTQIQQIVLNLAVNARDAMPGGGQLAITTAAVEVDDSLPWAHGSRYVLLTVSDTGSGMSKEVMAHIFEPFFTTKGVGKGTGLGLSTVYGIVEQGGGHVEVTSVLQKGTTFSIYLPELARPQERPPVPAPRRPRPQKPPLLPSRRETLLLVEDDEVIRRLAERVLKAKGYQVLMATNGAEAVQVSAEHTGFIHLMLTDVVMPIMNGIDLARELGGTRPDMRVLFMSGYVPEATGAGHLANTLQKPFTADSLVSKVQEVLAKRA